MDTGSGNALSRPPGAGLKRGHQTAKGEAPIAKNPLKPTDFEAVKSPEMDTGGSNALSLPLGAGIKRGHQTRAQIAKKPKPADFKVLEEKQRLKEERIQAEERQIKEEETRKQGQREKEEAQREKEEAQWKEETCGVEEIAQWEEEARREEEEAQWEEEESRREEEEAQWKKEEAWREKKAQREEQAPWEEVEALREQEAQWEEAQWEEEESRREEEEAQWKKEEAWREKKAQREEEAEEAQRKEEQAWSEKKAQREEEAQRKKEQAWSEKKAQWEEQAPWEEVEALREQEATWEEAQWEEEESRREEEEAKWKKEQAWREQEAQWEEAQWEKEKAQREVEDQWEEEEAQWEEEARREQEARVAEELDPLSSESNPDLLLPDDSSPPTPLPPTPPPPTWKEQYEKAIQQRGSVTLHITRCVLIGPPRVGKSSLKLLLINNEPPDQHVEKSTDLMEAPVVLTSIQCQKGNGSQWKELTPNNLQQLVSKCTREEGYDPAQPNPIQSSHSSQLTPEESFSHTSTAFTSDTDNVSTAVAESSNISMHLVDSELERRYHDFVEATMSEESLAELKINGLKMVHVFDCGGQLAFQDTIPLLINAPCTFISVFNASVDLDEEIELKYCPEKGKELDRGHKESQWNILRRIFSSIHSLQFKCHENILHLIKGIKVVPSSPIAVVGTHKDVLHKASEKDGGLRQRSTEKKIKERLEQLRESKLYDFVREKGCTHDLVTNQSKDDLSDINSLREDIERKATLPLELPLSWIILELFTRHSLLEKKFIPIDDLQQLCILKNIVSHKKEFLSLLQVLHVLGFYAFYQLDGVPEDQNWVCTDAATLYGEVTKLLMVQSREKFRKGATTELKQLGRIKLNKATLEDIFTDLEVNIGGADPMWFIRVLIHIGLAAKIENEGEEEVFIPLALPFKRSDFPPVTSVATICFTLEFPCGANKGRVRTNVIEIPRGIFPRLIVHLLSQQRSGEFEWLVNKGDSCSWIKLIHHSYKYVIYLNEHVDHIELALVLNDTFLATGRDVMRNTEVGHLCRKLREQLKSALGATFGLVFSEQPLERKPTAVCGLKCSVCRDSSHMAIVHQADESTQHPLYTEKCVHKGLPKTVEKPDQLIWFPPVKETTFERKETTCGDKQWTIWVMKGAGTSKSDVTVVESVSDLMPYYMDMTAHLFELAAALEVVELSKALINGHGTPEDKCLQILHHWLKSTPRPTWTLLCQMLRLVSSFKAVVHKIATDHNLPTGD